MNKQRLSEFFQVMYQLLSPGKLMVSPRLSIGSTLTLDDLGNYRESKRITAEIIKKAQDQFVYHKSEMLTPSALNSA